MNIYNNVTTRQTKHHVNVADEKTATLKLKQGERRTQNRTSTAATAVNTMAAGKKVEYSKLSSTAEERLRGIVISEPSLILETRESNQERESRLTEERERRLYRAATGPSFKPSSNISTASSSSKHKSSIVPTTAAQFLQSTISPEQNSKNLSRGRTGAKEQLTNPPPTPSRSPCPSSTSRLKKPSLYLDTRIEEGNEKERYKILKNRKQTTTAGNHTATSFLNQPYQKQTEVSTKEAGSQRARKYEIESNRAAWQQNQTSKVDTPYRRGNSHVAQAPRPPPEPAGQLSQKSNSLVGIALSHAIRLAITQDRLQPQRRTLLRDFSQEVEHLPYIELSDGGIQFKCIDWCPVVFRNLRESQGVSFNEYLDALGNTPLQGGEQGSGKSGAIFFKSHDEKFVVKEIKRSERECLLRILPDMVTYLNSHRFSFLPRFMGMYTVEALPGVFSSTMTIIVMKNIIHFPKNDPEAVYQEVYDLKGSVHNRFTSSSNQRTGSLGGKQESPSAAGSRQRSRHVSLESKFYGHDEDNFMFGSQLQEQGYFRRGSDVSTKSANSFCGEENGDERKSRVLKDLNLRCKFSLGGPRKILLMRQLQLDVEWLETHNLMDYSLLLGVVSTEPLTAPAMLHDPQRTSSSVDTFGDGFSTPTNSEYDPDCSFEHFLEDDDAIDSELSAVLRRNNQTRRESAALIPEGATVKTVKLIGHGQAKRSRESSTFFRSNCTIYTFLITRNEAPLISISPRGIDLNSSGFFASDSSSPKHLSASHDWVIFRRYKDFEKLYKGLQDELKSANSSHRLPALPKKQMIGFMEPSFVKQRQNELERWIQSILALVGYRIDSPHLLEFLTLKANRCPPKWRAQDDLRQLVHRKSSASFSQCSQPSPTPKSPHSMPIRQGFQPSNSNQVIDALQAFNEQSDLSPNSKECAPLWNTLGNQDHANIQAIRVSTTAAARPSPDQNVRLFVGIIDILQEFNLSKKLESVFKGLRAHADGISAVDPERYGERFLAFMDEFAFD